MSVDVKVVSVDEKMWKDIFKLKDYIHISGFPFLNIMVISNYKTRFLKGIVYLLTHFSPVSHFYTRRFQGL